MYNVRIAVFWIVSFFFFSFFSISQPACFIVQEKKKVLYLSVLLSKHLRINSHTKIACRSSCLSIAWEKKNKIFRINQRKISVHFLMLFTWKELEHKLNILFSGLDNLKKKLNNFLLLLVQIIKWIYWFQSDECIVQILHVLT